MSPKTAEAIPPMPKAKPKKSPEMSPNLDGSSSCAYTKMAEKAEERIKPIIMLNTHVAASPTCGISSVKGATPRIDPHITYLRPTLSPIGPPRSVPKAMANRKANK